MQKKKLMNFRLFLVLAVIMMFSVVMAIKVFVLQSTKLIIIFILAALALGALVCLCISKKKLFAFLLSCLLAAIAPITSIYFKTEKINANKSLNVEMCYISGKIYKVDENLSKNILQVYLTNVELSDGENSLDFYGNFKVNLSSNNVETNKVSIGQYVKVKCEPLLYSLQDDEYLSSIAKGVNGSAYAYSYTFWFQDKVDLNLRDRIRISVYDLFNKTDSIFSSVGYAMIFGDVSIVNDAVYDVFKGTGIAHLLAVSGFHISVIIVALSFFLKKLKVNKKFEFLIVSIVVLFYAYLCDFSVSIIRAGIMSLVLLYSGIRNKEYDRLNSLALAACLILLINPLDGLNVSFVLSFVSVLSIILLTQPIEHLLSKIFKNKFSSSLALCIAVSLGMMVFQLYYFKSVSLLTFFANFVTVPLVSSLFIFLLVSVLITALFGLPVWLISAYGVAMKYILQFNNLICGIGFNIAVGEVAEISLVLSLILMFVVSDYVFLRTRNKIIVSSVLGVIIVLLLFV